MNANQLHVFMAVENLSLRAALLSAIEPLKCSPTVIDHSVLMGLELSGLVMVLLETSDDAERLIETAQRIWSRWGDKENSDVQIVSYSTADVTPDPVVFSLWNVGREMAVLVQVWNPEDPEPTKLDTFRFTQRVQKSVNSASD